jgi:hypothetical protein
LSGHYPCDNPLHVSSGYPKEAIRAAEAMLKDTANYPFVGDVIERLRISRTAFYRYFPPHRIRELRNQA